MSETPDDQSIVDLLRSADATKIADTLAMIFPEEDVLIIRSPRKPGKPGGIYSTRSDGNRLFVSVLQAGQYLGGLLGIHLNWVRSATDDLDKLVVPGGGRPRIYK